MVPMQRTMLLLVAACVGATALAQERRPQFPNPNVRNARVAKTGYELIEAENLVRGASATAGPVSAQAMAPFGTDWSGGAQLFWQPPGFDARNPATLTLRFDVPSPGTYTIRLGYTRAPDYGDVALSIDGKLERELLGYAAQVSRVVTTLADRHLDSGPTELTLKVFRKNAQSRGFFVGLDSVELLLIQPGANRNVQTRADPAQTPPPATAAQTPQGPIVGNSAQLAFSTTDAKLNQGALGGVEGSFYAGNPTILLAWKTNAKNVQWQWQWQAATQSFPVENSLTPAGLIAQAPVTKSPFTIDFSKIPPFGTTSGVQSAQPSGPQTAKAVGPLAGQGATPAKPTPTTVYVRLVPLANGQPAGPPSNPVTAHYKAGADPILQGPTLAANTDQYKKKMLGYTIAIEKYDPAKWPNRIGCVVITKNSYKLPHPIGAYVARAEPYCPKPKDEKKDALYWVGEAVHGWFMAYDLGAKYYNAAKQWIVEQIVGPIPCEWLGDDLESTCDGAFHIIVSSAIDAAMVSAGVPPSIPDLAALEAAAKGDLIDGAVDFTCDQVQETGDHECGELTKEALHKIYQQGLDAMIKEATRGAHEPDCDNANLGVDYHLLPCFTDYPGVELHPAPGALYVPPMVTLKVTRTTAPPSPYLACTLRMSLYAKNHFSGTSYVQGQKLPEKDIAGELYEPATAPIALLQKGESETIKVAFQKMRLFSIATNSSTPSGSLGEWGTLYWGGQGTLSVDSAGPVPLSAAGGMAPCSNNTSKQFALPVKP